MNTTTKEAKAKTESFHFRMPDEVVSLLKERAKKERRSLNQMARIIIEDALTKQ